MKPQAFTAFLAVTLCISPALAETLTFEADGNVVFVRAYDQFGIAIVEFIGEPGAIYQCVAVDASGKPLATGPAMSDVGQAMFNGISAPDIKSFACRKTM